MWEDHGRPTEDPWKTHGRLVPEALAKPLAMDPALTLESAVTKATKATKAKW